MELSGDPDLAIATSDASLSLIVPRLTSFGEDAQGRLYMTSRS